MARPREFDVDDALERAMQLFWRQGFEATSLSDLTEHLGIARASLYGTFGSKHELYARALERYCDDQQSVIARLAERGPIKPALEEALGAMIDADLDDPERGCLMVNSITERADDPDTVRAAQRNLRDIERAVRDAVIDAQAAGEVPADKDPAQLARFIVTVIQGLRVVGKAQLGGDFLRDALAVAMRTLD